MSPRVVIRGGGSIGRRHAEVFRALGAEVALWPVRERREQAFDHDTGVPLLRDAEGVAAYAGADLVVVATDTGRHVDDALTALDHGCARLLVEKPVAPTLTDIEPLLRHPRAQQVFVAAPLRAHRAFQEVLRAAEVIARPASALVYSQSWLPDWRPERDYRASYSARADEGGVLRDLVHEIDYAMALFGPPTNVTARLDRSGPLEMAAEQGASLLWSTPEGVTVSTRLDYITRPSRRGLELFSPSGSLCWDVARATIRRVAANGDVSECHFPEDLDRHTVMATQARATLDLAPTSEPVRLRSAGAPATLAEGCAAVAVCDAAREADTSPPTR